MVRDKETATVHNRGIGPKNNACFISSSHGFFLTGRGEKNISV
jgi:hypothetical protein